MKLKLKSFISQQLTRPFLVRRAVPIVRRWHGTSSYEWLKSLHLILERASGHNRSWLTKPNAPLRTDLPILDQCFSQVQAIAALKEVSHYAGELRLLPPALGLNHLIGPADVAFYWMFIRKRKPDTIIEIGSGYSTRVALRAVKKNKHGRVICIDPEPQLRLPRKRLTHISSKVEDVDSRIFDNFQPHDILFIDSSHRSAEVRHHAEFLDRLPIGALVHYHDIDYPWSRPHQDLDEDAIVAEFLANRPNWEIIVSGSMLTRDFLNEMRVAIPQYRRTPYRLYNALWIAKVA
jgi:predicted O-methyltransferase YrrM